MGWTDPDASSFAGDEEVTASKLNTYVRDNLSWLGIDHPRAAAYGTLTVANGTTLDVPDGTWTGCSPNVGGMYASTEESLLFTSAGSYFIACTAIFPDAGGKRGLALGPTVSGGNLTGSIGAGTLFCEEYSEPTANDVTGLSVSTLVTVSANTRVYIGCRQNSGGALSVQFRLSAIWMAAS